MVLMGNAPVVFKSKFQRTVALSSAEAEYMALSLCVQEVLWMPKNAGYNSRTKHVDIKHHFTRENVENGTVLVDYIDTKQLLADLLTKALGTKTLKYLREASGIKAKATVPSRRGSFHLSASASADIPDSNTFHPAEINGAQPSAMKTQRFLRIPPGRVDNVDDNTEEERTLGNIGKLDDAVDENMKFMITMFKEWDDMPFKQIATHAYKDNASPEQFAAMLTMYKEYQKI
ncbi:Retrotransposon Polyprotein, partial [Phytophthora palmivora]